MKQNATDTMKQRWGRLILLLSLLGLCEAFQAPVAPLFHSTTTASSLSRNRQHHHDSGFAKSFSTPLFANRKNTKQGESSFSILRRLLDTTTDLPPHPAGTLQHSGLFGPVKKVHNPITYFCLGIMAGFRWDWCFRSPLYWFAIAFTIKWYRARYVFKIPVWDRQPNWNNVITSKDQEKELKALTCKTCGSTIFIAKTREFFFEGTTGIGGLGCFSCGTKGKDNFVMDRERIVEEIGDMDDYFEYERPLDLVSRAERKELLKKAKGDEEKANELAQKKISVLDADVISSSTTAEETQAAAVEDTSTTVNGDAAAVPLTNGETNGETTTAAPKKRKKKKTKKKISSSTKKNTSIPQKTASSDDSTIDLDDLDVLDMDAW